MIQFHGSVEPFRRGRDVPSNWATRIQVKRSPSMGFTSGPYLILPLLPPLTLRDAIGYAADSFMDPLSYFVTPVLADVGRSATHTINERAANMTEYDDVEDTSLDLYAAVRNGYLQRRQHSVRGAIRNQDRTWAGVFNRSEETSDTRLGDLAVCRPI